MSQTFRLFGEKTLFKHEAAAHSAASGMKYLKPSSSYGMRTGEANFAAGQVAAIEPWNPQTTFVRQEKARSFSTNRVERPELAPSSMQLVFQRLQRIDEGKGRSSPVQQSVNDLTLRVARQTQRVEQRAFGTPATVLTRPTAATSEQHRATPVVETEHRAEGMPEIFDRRTGVWTGNNSAQMSDMNMEQITEHVMRRIDDRVIAMRERMGYV
jgi:hypothetical protein